MSNIAPVVTPSALVVEKEQVVVIEFRRDIPKSSFLTLDIYYEGSNSKFITLPTALLGPRTVRAMFPVFPKPGTVRVSVLLARDEDCRFPQFKLKVQSPVESLASALPSTTGPKQAARLAAVIAYLANCTENDNEAAQNADEVVSEIFKGLQPADLPEWTLAWFLCGKFSPAANLLHVCTRHNLSQSLDILLQPWFIEDKAHCLLQKGLDDKTPVDIAKRNNLTAVSEKADQLVDRGAMKLSTPKAKKKFALKPDIQRAPSIDSNLQHLVQDGSTSPAKKKGKSAKRVLRQLFRSDTKDKVNTSAPQYQTPDQFQVHGNVRDSNEDIHSVTLPRNYRQSVISISNPEVDPEPELSSGNSTYFMAGRDETLTAYEQRQGSKTLSRIEQTSKPLEQYQQPPPPPTNWNSDKLQVTEHRLRPVSSLSSGYGSAVSNAVAELKEKAIYKAEVVKQYKFVSSASSELVLEIGDKMYVTQEVEDNICLGVCNDHYCKVPKSVLCVLSNCNDGDLDDDHDYDKVIFPGESDDGDDDEGIYKIPRNVPRVAESGSDSDNSDHVYDVPPNKDDILSYLIEEGHYQKVPTRSSMLATVMFDNLELGRDHDSTPQDKQPTVDRQSERDMDHQQKTPTVGTTAPQSQTELQQWDRELANDQEDKDADGIYDVPSSILRSAYDTSTGEPHLEYNVMIPISTHSAKVADGTQQKDPGWGYEETKDIGPLRAATMPSHQDHTHSTNPNRFQISDSVSSKQAPFVKHMDEIEDTPDAKLACYLANNDPWNEKCNTIPHVHSAIIDGGNEYPEDSGNEDMSGIYDVPSAILRSIDDPVAPEPLAELSSNRREAKRSSDTEETRDIDTPEGSEGSDVFVDHFTVMSTTAQGKTNSLPPFRHQSLTGAAHTTPPQKVATLDTHRHSGSRTRIASAPHVSPKPRPAKRTKITQSQEQSSSQFAGNMLFQLPESPQEKPLPDEPQPPVLPERPPPALPEKPTPIAQHQTSPPPRPEKPLPILPNEPSPPPLPEKPSPVATDKVKPEKPLPPLPGEPALEPPAIPDRPTPERTALGKPSEYQDSQTDQPIPGRNCQQTSNRTPKPKPRRIVPAAKQEADDGGYNYHGEVRLGRFHTAASFGEMSATGSSSTSPSMNQRHTMTTSEWSPKFIRAVRAKSASDAEINSTVHTMLSPQHSTDGTGTTIKAKVAAPPVARKPNKVSPNSSPMLTLNRLEHSKPTTAPKPKRH